MEDKESDTERIIDDVCREEYPLPEVTVNRSKCFRIPISIEPLVFSLFLADTLSESVTLNLILMRTCLNHFHYNQSVCNQLTHSEQNITDLEKEVQPYAADILAGMSLLSKILPAFLSLFVGTWSDENGRKLILVIPALGYVAHFSLLIVMSFYSELGPEYGLLVVMPVALTGGFTNFITGVFSYISDISQEENRSFRMNLMESVMYSSVYIGFLSCSYLLKAGGSYGYLLVYGVCDIIVLVTVIPTYFFVPESVQRTERGQGLLKIFDFQRLGEMFHACFKKRENSKRTVILIIILILSTTIGIMVGESNVLYLYTKLRFGWDVQEFTIWASVMLLCSFIGLLVGSGIFSLFLKTSDVFMGIISYTFKAISAFYVGFIPSRASNLMYYNGFFAIFNGFCGPAGRAILSKTVSKDDLGKVFALLGAAEAIFPLAVGPLYTVFYNFTINKTPNVFFFITGGAFFICALLYVFIYFLQRRHKQTEHERLYDETVEE